MDKAVEAWKVGDLETRFRQIHFPEYQREPNIWSLAEKQRLIDSMLREFDIASLYFYRHEDGAFDCVDGRQRIGAIMSFLGKNPNDEANGFEFSLRNEIYSEAEPLFEPLQGRKFDNIRDNQCRDSTAKDFVDRFMKYKLTIVILSSSQNPAEFNLQFTRLNLGTIINSGEKLNAMVGDLRNQCFAKDEIGSHAFLENTKIPTRRFSRQQVAAQILAQVFTYHGTSDYARTRHFDLQRLFKRHSHLTEEYRELIRKTVALLDLLGGAFQNPQVLKNRALTVSTVMLAWTLGVQDREAASRLAKFVEEFVCRLNWQVKKGLDVDSEYRYLIRFQRHVTQASVERLAVTERASVLKEQWQCWSGSCELQGDAEWIQQNPGKTPSEECRSIAF